MTTPIPGLYREARSDFVDSKSTQTVLPDVAACSLANVSISSAPSTIDGYALVSSGSDRILLVGQTTASQNGVWVWNGTGNALTRPLDFRSGLVLTSGRSVLVENGTINARTTWSVGAQTGSTVTVDTTAQTWGQGFNAAFLADLPVVNVQNPLYAGGAVGNGSTDDHAAIQAAINALPPTGGIVYFPPTRAGSTTLPANYGISTGLTVGNGNSVTPSSTAGVWLMGGGVSNPGYLLNPNFTPPVQISALNSTMTMLTVNGPLAGWKITDIFFNGNGYVGVTGLKAISVCHGQVSNATFTNMGYGFALTTNQGVAPPTVTVNSGGAANQAYYVQPIGANGVVGQWSGVTQINNGKATAANTISWSAVTGATGYFVARFNGTGPTSPVGEFIIVGYVTGTSYSDTQPAYAGGTQTPTAASASGNTITITSGGSYYVGQVVYIGGLSLSGGTGAWGSVLTAAAAQFGGLYANVVVTAVGTGTFSFATTVNGLGGTPSISGSIYLNGYTAVGELNGSTHNVFDRLSFYIPTGSTGAPTGNNYYGLLIDSGNNTEDSYCNSFQNLYFNIGSAYNSAVVATAMSYTAGSGGGTVAVTTSGSQVYSVGQIVQLAGAITGGTGTWSNVLGCAVVTVGGTASFSFFTPITGLGGTPTVSGCSITTPNVGLWMKGSDNNYFNGLHYVGAIPNTGGCNVLYDFTPGAFSSYGSSSWPEANTITHVNFGHNVQGGVGQIGIPYFLNTGPNRITEINGIGTGASPDIPPNPNLSKLIWGIGMGAFPANTTAAIYSALTTYP